MPWGSVPAAIALVVLAVLTGQLSIGWSNDLIDLPRDRAVGRTDKPLVDGSVSERSARLACGLALVATVPLSLANGWLAGVVHLVVVAAGWAYNLGAKATAWSWLPYAVAFGALPAFVSLAAEPDAVPPLWLPLAGALLGVGAHVVNVLPDLADDAATGVRGLPHRIGPRWSPVAGGRRARLRRGDDRGRRTGRLPRSWRPSRWSSPASSPRSRCSRTDVPRFERPSRWHWWTWRCWCGRDERRTSWDLVVVGAGPAGSTTALAALHADPSLRVLLLDRADFPRDKSCGDGIAPHCFAALASIGVTGVEDGWTPLTELELARGEQSVAATMARPVYVIPREVFDARLVERAVERGAVFRRQRVTDVDQLPDARRRRRRRRRALRAAPAPRPPRTAAAPSPSAATPPRRRTGAAPR